MNGLGQFLAMGGYGFYVWSAYGAGLVILGLVWADGALRRRRAERALARIREAPPSAKRPTP